MNASGNLQALLRSGIAKVEALWAKEKAPPGYEPVVRALKKAPGVDNPFAVAWSMKGKGIRPAKKKKESASPSTKPGTVRISETSRESGKIAPRVLEAMKDGPNGEKIFKVILISEGPGNRRNKNFYGPEAVSSAVKAFEGRWCYLNHQAEDEAETLPERRIEDKAGYYKGLAIMKVTEGTACAGELHCDLSESGAMLAAKVQSALKYKESFPDNDLEYVGFSVNADGTAEPRDMTAKGGSDEDNYVTEITEGDSCDLVTTPARGGRGLSVIKEDKAGGVNLRSQEDRMKKKLAAILAKFSEAFKSLADEEKKKLAESHKALTALVEAEDGGEACESESEAESWVKKQEGESDEDHLKRLHGMAKAVAGHLGKMANPEDEDEAEAESEADDSDVDADKKPADDADSVESKKDALAGLIKESGLPTDSYSEKEIARLEKLPYREAKAIVQKDAKLAEAIRKQTIKDLEMPAASLHRGAVSGADNDAGFLSAAKGE